MGCIVRKLPEHYERGLFTLANLGTSSLPLLIGAPFATLVPLGLRCCPEAHRIDAPIWLFARYVDGRKCKLPRGVPRHSPVAHPCLDCVDNLGRNPSVNVP